MEGGASPLCELVATQDIFPLCVLIDLYAEQNLVADGGISRRVVYRGYKKQRVGERGEVVIWAFVPENMMYRGSSDLWMDRYEDTPFWNAITTLTALGLLGCVEHLTQSDSEDSEIAHALPTLFCRASLNDENRIGRAAWGAAFSLLTPTLQQEIEVGDQRNALLVPVQRHLPKVHCFGIYRLTHRPHTALTAEWALQSRKAAELYAPKYEQLQVVGERAAQKALERYQRSLEKSA